MRDGNLNQLCELPPPALAYLTIPGISTL